MRRRVLSALTIMPLVGLALPAQGGPKVNVRVTVDAVGRTEDPVPAINTGRVTLDTLGQIF